MSELSDADAPELMISWLAEFTYCKRRFYLRVCEQNDIVNEYMASGTVDHGSVHTPVVEKRKEIVKVTGLHIFSGKYCLRGICDNVEFHKSSDGVYIDFLNDTYIPCPIEYKHGKKRNKREYNVQLMAQAFCMEEMYGITLDYGYIYYTSARERIRINFDENLRLLTKKKIEELVDFIKNPILDKAIYMKRCPKCSVYDLCAPKDQMVGRYIKSLWKQVKI